MFEQLKNWLKGWLEARASAAMPESRIIVTTDDSGVRAEYPDGPTQQVSWKEITRVTIETNDSGPWGADLWWVLEGGRTRCAYPGGATGEQEALKSYESRLPGFDWEAVIRASGSTGNATFTCWERGGAG